MSVVTVIEPEAAVAKLPAAMGDPEVAALAAATVPLMGLARAFVIDSPAAAIEAKELLAQASKAAKRSEALRKRWTGPLLDVKRRIDHDFSRITEPAKTAERILREKLALYSIERRHAIEQTAKEIAAEAGLQVVAVPTTVETAAGTVTERVVWDFTVDDPGAVPHQYLMVDAGRIRAAVAAGVRSIPGVSIFETVRQVVR